MPTEFDSKPSITLEFPALGAGARRPKFEKFPVLFPVNREFGCRDGFDNDCVRHHALCRNGKSLRDWRIASNRRASAWRLGLRGDCFSKRGDFGRVVSGPRIPIPRCSIGTWGVDSESEPASLNTEHLSWRGHSAGQSRIRVTTWPCGIHFFRSQSSNVLVLLGPGTPIDASLGKRNMRRPKFLAGLSAASAKQLLARAHQPRRPVIGFLHTRSRRWQTVHRCKDEKSGRSRFP